MSPYYSVEPFLQNYTNVSDLRNFDWGSLKLIRVSKILDKNI